MIIRTDPANDSISIESPQVFVDAIRTWQGNLRIVVGDSMADGHSRITIGKSEARALGQFLLAYADGGAA